MRKQPFVKLLLTRLGFFVSALILYSGSLLAQDDGSEEGFHFGAKVGVVTSTFTNQQPHTDINQGLTGGIFTYYNFNSQMAAQVEINYLQQGGRLLQFDVPGLVGDQNYYALKANNQQVIIHTIDVPVLFKYSQPIGGVSVFGLIGPTFGYNLKSDIYEQTTVFTEIGSFHTFSDYSSNTESIEPINYAATAGVGLSIPFDSFNLLIDARYRYGINSIYNSYSYVGIPQVTGNLQSHQWTLTVGASF